jgi:xylan 1,4-beta-xylosidase
VVDPLDNPIIPGFHPDPDIIRVGSDYFITTTSFEWFPGIPIHHSTDLVNWRLIGHALGPGQMDLAPVPDSGGVYIPSIAWHEGTFYLVYSIVYEGAWPHVANRCHLITANDITGPWSEPVYLNSMAFDPAVFIDRDGRIHIVNLVMETRPGRGPQMKGFMLQEYDPRAKRLIGEARMIFETADHLLHPEGPHLYHIGEYYYLMCAIGGTKWEHATLFMRSHSLWGPYEIAPKTPLLTSKGDPGNPLQKAGQGCIVDTPEGDWFLAHHAGRPVGSQRVCPLGRETCLQQIRWNAEGWPELAHGGIHPATTIRPPSRNATKASTPALQESIEETFSSPELDPEWCTLREPPSADWLRVDPQAQCLSLRGRQPIAARYQQSLVARRWTSVHFTAATRLDFKPSHYRQMAGLICYYDTSDFAYAYLTHDEEVGRCLQLVQRISGRPWHECPRLARPVAVPHGPVELRVRVAELSIQFAYRGAEAADWTPLGEELDGAHLSDEGTDGSLMRFTGAFVGMAAHDPLYESEWARFYRFAVLPS